MWPLTSQDHKEEREGFKISHIGYSIRPINISLFIKKIKNLSLPTLVHIPCGLQLPNLWCLSLASWHSYLLFCCVYGILILSSLYFVLKFVLIDDKGVRLHERVFVSISLASTFLAVVGLSMTELFQLSGSQATHSFPGCSLCLTEFLCLCDGFGLEGERPFVKPESFLHLFIYIFHLFKYREQEN